MARNYNSLGKNVTFELGVGPTPSVDAVKSGAFVKEGNIWGVALIDEYVDKDNKRKVVVATEGIWLLPVKGVYSFGKYVFVNNDGELTFDSLASKGPVGVVVGTDTLDGSSVMKVRIQQAALVESSPA